MSGDLEVIDGLSDDMEKNRLEAYGPGPHINTRRTRFLPFMDGDKPMISLIHEWYGPRGEITRDSRQWMSEEEFLLMCMSASTVYDRLKDWFGYERAKRDEN
ncbi:MAG: hypothetical protein DI537_41155 [Stutzerimonas stutzeri]|nr:MAG: hypothetical protein DI537_41155 [Stutzerimonas stutzeri]